jgi:hypothetical protein
MQVAIVDVFSSPIKSVSRVRHNFFLVWHNLEWSFHSAGLTCIYKSFIGANLIKKNAAAGKARVLLRPGYHGDL